MTVLHSTQSTCPSEAPTERRRVNKRLIAITVLTVGLVPSIPILFADAATPNQRDLTRHCRTRLGFSQTEPLFGPLLLQLRRCIDNTRQQYEHADRLMRRSGVTHYSQRYDQAQSFAPPVKETQRSLNTRTQREEVIRLDYYHNTTLDVRDRALREHRISRRFLVQEAEHRLLREKRAKQQRWVNAIQVCRYIARNQRQTCVYRELSR